MPGRFGGRQRHRGRLPHRGHLPAGRRAGRDVSDRQRTAVGQLVEAAARRGRPARRALQHGRRPRRHRASAGQRGRAAQARRHLPGDEARRRTARARSGATVRDRGDDRPADRHLRTRRSAAAEAVSQRRASVSDPRPRRNLLPSHLHRRSGRRLPTVRRASGRGQPHLHPGRRRGDDAQRAGALIADAAGVRPPGLHLPVWPFWLAGAACEAVCVAVRHRAAASTGAASTSSPRAARSTSRAREPRSATRRASGFARALRRTLPGTANMAGSEPPGRGHLASRARTSCSRPEVAAREVRRVSSSAGRASARCSSTSSSSRSRRRARARFGLVLRKRLYPWLLGSCGRNVVFGQNVVLRHPHKIHIGSNVVIDDNCLLDAKGRVEPRHSHRQRRVHRPQHASCRARTATSTSPTAPTSASTASCSRPAASRIGAGVADGGVQLRHRRRSRFLGSVQAGARRRRGRRRA